MKRDDEALVWVVTGAVGSMALAVALIPLRSLVSASNLALAFVAFTIVVAEMGGRGPALVTALVAAMSLDFFLTEPYLTLAIDKRQDVIAFVAMAGCGLIAAAFGRKRGQLSEVARRADRELDMVSRFVAHTRSGRSLDALLQDLRADFRLEGLALREEDGRLLAAAPSGAGSLPAPRSLLAADTLLAAGNERVRFGSKGMRLPEGGGRLTLPTAHGNVTLDLWEGDDEGFTADESRTLAVAASILGLGMR
jgi:two-component system sensor histidine kinase KdpD